MTPINAFLSSLNQILVFVKTNLFWIVVVVYGLSYVYKSTELGHSLARNFSSLKERCMKLFQSSTNEGVINYGNMNASRNNQQQSAPSDRNTDIQRIREMQQERATKQALEAEKERKIKQAEERKRRNEIAQDKWKRGGQVLGGDDERPKRRKPQSSSSDRSSAASGYNPMQPWTSNTSGYRPARRNVSRG